MKKVKGFFREYFLIFDVGQKGVVKPAHVVAGVIFFPLIAIYIILALPIYFLSEWLNRN